MAHPVPPVMVASDKLRAFRTARLVQGLRRRLDVQPQQAGTPDGCGPLRKCDFSLWVARIEAGSGGGEQTHWLLAHAGPLARFHDRTQTIA